MDKKEKLIEILAKYNQIYNEFEQFLMENFSSQEREDLGFTSYIMADLDTGYYAARDLRLKLIDNR